VFLSTAHSCIRSTRAKLDHYKPIIEARPWRRGLAVLGSGQRTSDRRQRGPSAPAGGRQTAAATQHFRVPAFGAQRLQVRRETGVDHQQIVVGARPR
jgi:hypothetical protein